jgi:hypothetical protein
VPTVSTTQQGSTQSAPQTSVSTDAELNISSTPPGAEVELDGKFVGDTPSTVGVSPGDHVIAISKKGYKSWERKIKVTTGKIDIAAELESEPKVEPKPN